MNLCFRHSARFAFDRLLLAFPWRYQYTLQSVCAGSPPAVEKPGDDSAFVNFNLFQYGFDRTPVGAIVQSK